MTPRSCGSAPWPRPPDRRAAASCRRWRNVGAELAERADPGDEAALELFGIERGEQVAQLVVRRRAVLEGAKAAQRLKLLLAELGDLHPALGGGQHGHQAKQQHLVERIPYLAGLARVFEALEMLQPLNNLIERPLRLRLGLHHRAVLRESRGHRQIQLSQHLSREDSPDCPAGAAKVGGRHPRSGLAYLQRSGCAEKFRGAPVREQQPQ
jgi:hypothetical protein